MNNFTSVLFSFFLSYSALAAVPTQVTEVYSYTCEATFLEGEGVAANDLSCTPFQQLGLLKARYTHYVTDPSRQARDELYPDNVCNLEVVRTHCSGSAPELRFGLAAVADPIFSEAVKLSPGFGQAPELVGYAAKPVKGKCTEGLELMQAYRANPKSIRNPLPTSFINTNGSLDDAILIAPTKRLPRLEIQRERSNIACDEVGDCRGAHFDTAVGIQRADYKASGSPVCVVSKSALQ